MPTPLVLLIATYLVTRAYVHVVGEGATSATVVSMIGFAGCVACGLLLVWNAGQ